MFFFFFDDFDRELKDFNVTERLMKEQERASRQIAKFRELFPFSRLKRFSAEDFFRPYGEKGESFWHWATVKTNSVGGSLPWAAAKLNSSGRYRNAETLQLRFTNEDSGSLLGFIESKGRSGYEKVRHLIGSMLALRLLILYHPDEFMHIVRTEWIDQIVFSLGLDNSGTIVDRSLVVRGFYDDKSISVKRIPMVAFVQLLDDFIGLRPCDCKSFNSYLKSEKGVSETTIEKYNRALRKLSRQLNENGYIRHSLFKIREVGWLLQVLKDAKSLTKAKEYSEPLNWYRMFLDDTTAGTLSTNHCESKSRRLESETQISSIASLIAYLKTFAKERRFLRHYTTMTSFLYMAESLSLRLTRGDDSRMNDQLEWRKLGNQNTWKRTFILSLSGVEDESAAMWGLYGRPSNEAVRLTFRNATLDKWLSSVNRYAFYAQLFPSVGECGEKIALPPECVEILLVDVMYGGKVDEADGMRRSYKHHGNTMNLPILKKWEKETGGCIDTDSEMTGLIKSNDWEYEDETRIIARLKEDSKIHGINDLKQIQYIYLPISEGVLGELDLMVGPCVPDKLTPVFENKVKASVPGITVSRSKYAGKLIFK